MNRDLTEEIWRNSTLTMRQAERLVSEATARGVRLGRVEAYNASLAILRAIRADLRKHENVQPAGQPPPV